MRRRSGCPEMSVLYVYGATDTYNELDKRFAYLVMKMRYLLRETVRAGS